MQNDVDKAERLSRARAILFYLLAATFVASGLIGLKATHSVSQLVGWIVLALLIALNLTPYPPLFRFNRVKQLMNDEATALHRQRSFAAGFWAAIATAVGLAVVARTWPLAADDVARLVVTAALAAALVRFATLELRAAK